MKKFFFSLFLLCVLILPTSAHALQKGDWVSFGNYNGSPIIWRVFDESDEDLTLISDKVIDTMQYDETSADWGNSAIRMWLNSAENPSSGEKGFLCSDNFTAAQFNAIMTVNRQYTAAADETIGEVGHVYKNNAKRDILTNYDTALKKESQDKIFLPTVSDIQAIRNNSQFFGVSYHLAIPTARAVSSSFDFGMREGEPWHYWLMDSLSNSSENIFTRSVTRDNRISFQNCTDEWVGLRPMCCIEKGKFTFSDGDGSVENPYVLSTDNGIYITCDTLNVTVGKTISVQTYASSVGSGETVAKYLNGNRVYTDTLISAPGENEVYYCILDEDDNVVSKSNSIFVFASKSKIKKETIFESYSKNFYNMKKTDQKTIDLLSENTSESLVCGQFDPIINSNFVTKVTCKGDAESQVAQFKIENIIDSKHDNNAKIIGIDLFINELNLITHQSETEKFLDISLDGTEKLTIEALYLASNGLHNVIKDAAGNIVSQNKWYTFYLVYNFSGNEFKYSLYISEKGADFENANLVSNSSVSIVSSDCFSKGISLEIFQVADKTITCLIDNLFVENLLSACDAREYLRPGEKADIKMYIAPGFSNAEINFLGEEIRIFDNGTGFYLLETEIPQDISQGYHPLILSADYENMGTITSRFNAVCINNSKYIYIKTTDGRDFIYDVGGVDNMYISGNKTETKNFKDIKNRFEISLPTGYQADVTYSFDGGVSDDVSDKSLKVKIDSLTNVDGTTAYMGIGAYNTSEIAPCDSIFKVKYDIKFSSSDFILSFVTKTGETWDKTVQILDNYGSEYFADSDIKFEPDKWYTITGIYDLLQDKLDVYIDGIHFKEIYPNNSFENANVTQLHISCGSNEEGKNIFWIDNLSKEYIPQYGGIKDFNPFISKDEAFVLELNEKILDTGTVTLSLTYPNGEIAGEAEFGIDENQNTKIFVTPFNTFDENKNVFLTIMAGRTVVDTLVFTPIKTTVDQVSEIIISEDDNYVYATVSAEGEGDVGNLFLVSYSKNYSEIISISAAKLADCVNRTNFFTKVKKSKNAAHYKAFVWSPTLQQLRQKHY